MVQFQGPFAANEKIISSTTEISHLGIEASFGDIVVINEEEIQLCYRGILELENISVSSLYFKNDVNYAMITYN